MKIVLCNFLLYFLYLGGAAGHLSASVNKFGVKLYQGLLNEHKTRLDNIVLAPVLVQKALASLTLGADTDTCDAIQSGILLNESPTELADDFHQFLTSLVNDKNIEMTSVDFISSNYKINPLFIQNAADYYFSTVKSLDFSNSKAAAQHIDSWVSKRTVDEIVEIILTGDISNQTQFVMVNGLSFDGKWQHPFNPWYTEKSDFFKPELSPLFDSSSVSSSAMSWAQLKYQTKRVEAELMNTMGNFKYGYIDNLKAKAVLIPYTDPGYSLLVLLPERVLGIFEMENKLDSYTIDTILSQMTNQPVNFTFPRFALNLNIELSTQLRKMGMEYIFSSNATYDGVATPTGSTPPLAISDLIQKAQIIFTNGETYSEAGYPSSHPLPSAPKNTHEFKCDHPFMFFVLKGNSIILIGRIITA